MKLIVLALLTFCCAISVFATGQEPDRLVYQGKVRDLFTNPLEDYYKSNPEKRPDFMVKPLISDTGNWRGYVATWELSDGKLFLIKLDTWLCAGSTEESCAKPPLSKLFPKKVKGGR